MSLSTAKHVASMLSSHLYRGMRDMPNFQPSDNVTWSTALLCLCSKVDFSRHLLWVPLAHESSGSCLKKASNHAVAAFFHGLRPLSWGIDWHGKSTGDGGECQGEGGEHLYGKWEPQLLHLSMSCQQVVEVPSLALHQLDTVLRVLPAKDALLGGLVSWELCSFLWTQEALNLTQPFMQSSYLGSLCWGFQVLWHCSLAVQANSQFICQHMVFLLFQLCKMEIYICARAAHSFLK